MKSDKKNKQTLKRSIIQRSPQQDGSLVLLLLTCGLISACGGSSASAENNPVENTIQVTESPTESVEKFNFLVAFLESLTSEFVDVEVPVLPEYQLRILGDNR